MTCAPVSVQPGGQGHLVVHYLEGICQRGDSRQGKFSLPPATVPWSVSALCFRSSWTLLLRVPGLLLPQTCLSLSQQGLVGGWAVTESWLQGLVTTLHEGDDFGQLALVNDAPRAATIILRENNCHFLRVDKQDFNRIIKVPWGWGR